jgi:nucleolar protein 15
MKKSDDKKSKAPKKPKEPSPEAESEVQDYDSEVENAEEDDQTAALLAGFESEGDESDIAKEDEAFDIENPEVEIPGHLTKSLTKASKNTNHPGVVFVGYANASLALAPH